MQGLPINRLWRSTDHPPLGLQMFDRWETYRKNLGEFRDQQVLHDARVCFEVITRPFVRSLKNPAVRVRIATWLRMIPSDPGQWRLMNTGRVPSGPETLAKRQRDAPARGL